MVIFRSYVKLPEGINRYPPRLGDRILPMFDLGSWVKMVEWPPKMWCERPWKWSKSAVHSRFLLFYVRVYIYIPYIPYIYHIYTIYIYIYISHVCIYIYIYTINIPVISHSYPINIPLNPQCLNLQIRHKPIRVRRWSPRHFAAWRAGRQLITGGRLPSGKHTKKLWKITIFHG